MIRSDSIRKELVLRFPRWFRAAVVLAGAAAFSLSACGDKKAPPAVAFPDSLVDTELIATVNGQAVTGHDLRAFTLIYEPQTRDSLTNRMFNVQLLKGYMDRLLLWQEARAAGVTVDDSTQTWYVNAFVQSVGGENLIGKFLSQVGATRGELVATIRRDLMVRRLIETQVSPSVNVTEKDARAYYDANADRLVSKEQDGTSKPIPYDDIRDRILEGLRQRALDVALENHLKRNRAVAIIVPNFDVGGLTQRESTTFTR